MHNRQELWHNSDFLIVQMMDQYRHVLLNEQLKQFGKNINASQIQ